MYKASGTGESLTFQEKETPSSDPDGLLVVTGGKTTIENYDTLNFINHDPDRNKKHGIAVEKESAKLEIQNVNTINFGTGKSQDELLQVKTDDGTGVAIHGYKGDIEIGTGADNQATVDTLNVYSANVGIMAQHTAGNGAGHVKVHVSKAVNVYSDDASAVQVSNFGTGDGSVTDNDPSLSIVSDGTVSVESNGYQAVLINDQYEYDGPSNPGDSTVTISGKEGVSLISAEKANGKNTSRYLCGIQIYRAASGTSSVDVSSENGDVFVSGAEAAVRLTGHSDTASSGPSVGATIHGKNVTLESTKEDSTSSALDLSNSKLTVTGDSISVNAANDQAIKVSGSKGNLTFGDGKANTDVYVNGYMTVTDGATATFAEGTTTHVDSKYLTDDKGKVFITTGNGSGKVTFEKDSHLDIGNVATGTELKFSDSEYLNQAAAGAIQTNNVLQDITMDGTQMKVVMVDKKDVGTLLKGALLANTAYEATKTNAGGFADLLTGENDVEALNSAAGLSAMAGVEHGTYTAAGIFNDAVAGHLMNRNDEDVWAYGFHNKENVNGLSFGADYDAQYNGVVAGVDLYRKGGTVAGIALSYADGNVSGSNGFASTQNDADYYGASLYARFDRGSYALLGDISYMRGDHDVTQWNKGQQITASPDSDAVSVGVKAVKDFTAGESGTLTPYIGVRYLRLSTDGFTAYNASYSGDDQDLVLIPVGVNYSAAITGGSWTFRPYAGVGYIWNAGDKSADQTVTLGTAANSFSYDTVDSGSFLTRVGFTADHGDMSYGVGYSWQKGDSVSNNAWTLSASFRF